MDRRRFKIRRGLDIPLQGAPVSDIDVSPPPQRIGVLGPDYPIKHKLDVKAGGRVVLGQPLFHDKKDPRIRITAPGTGIVETIQTGPRRALRAVVIRLAGDDEEAFRTFDGGGLDAAGRQDLIDQLLASGLWTAFRSRPFGGLARPDDQPDGIFVTAMDTQPLAIGAESVINENPVDFAFGLRVLARLTSGPVHVCVAPQAHVPLPEQGNVCVSEFAGPHPAGLPGTHMHFLLPAGARRLVWHVGAQDVIALGFLFRTGRIRTERVVTLAGSMAHSPRRLRTRLGVSLTDLLNGELKSGPVQVISGSPLNGHHALGWSDYLGRYHQQVTAIPDGEDRPFMTFMRPGMDDYSATNAYISSVLPPANGFNLRGRLNGSRRALVPIGNLEDVIPLDILPAPLLKALIVRDTETAANLGCLELVEEDLALATFVCPSKINYGSHLRACLDLIERDG